MREFFAAYWLEIFLLCVLAYYAIDGYSRGFLLLLLETVGFVAAMTLSALVYRFPAKLIEQKFSMPYLFAAAIAFFGVWWLVDLVWPLVVRRVYRRIPDGWKSSKWNRWIGAAPGIFNGALLFSVLLTVLLSFPVPAALKNRVTSSPIAKPLLALSAAMDRAFKPILGPIAEQSINLITIHPQSGETLNLHFTVQDGAPDPESEQAMLASVNQERRKNGLVALKWSLALQTVARAHSDDMFKRGYFSHTDPDGLNPAQRVSRAGIPYGMVGENLALAPTVEIAHQGLMDSPGHRANILNKDFRKIGIGVIDGGIYGKMFTQLFTD